MQIQVTEKIKINLRQLKTVTKCQFIISETQKCNFQNLGTKKSIFKFQGLKKAHTPNSGTKIVFKPILYMGGDSLTPRVTLLELFLILTIHFLKI